VTPTSNEYELPCCKQCIIYMYIYICMYIKMYLPLIHKEPFLACTVVLCEAIVSFDPDPEPEPREPGCVSV
jgi:hypothetical protein